MHHRLHTKLKAATEPFAYEEYRKQRVQQKLEAGTSVTEMRITRNVTTAPAILVAADADAIWPHAGGRNAFSYSMDCRQTGLSMVCRRLLYTGGLFQTITKR
eukprot:3927901-Amphidinium_carterae.1